MDNNDKNNKDKKENGLKDKMKKVTQKDGFYLVLFLCIMIVGVTAVWVSGDNFKQISELEKEEDLDDDILDYYPDNEESQIGAIEEPDQEPKVEEQEEEKTQEEPKEPQKEENTEKQEQESNPKPEPKEQAKNEEQAVEVSANARRAKAMLVPIMGKQSMSFAGDQLVYSETLEQWTTHNGLDITAKKGSSVRAVLKGVVKSVEETDDLGRVITIDHGEGLITKYAGLSEKTLVKKGQNVNKGDAIGAIGEPAGYELSQGPHLHFEVLENGKHIDPKDYIPDFE
ncbi:M23 family metallopeptidase [Senegalia massiliensis]|uniref:M23 family metallopeptidase n=1 Tax=Senegalia massiliensis TaxID=1720316 RepID=UPI0010321CB7|nr:M23 family metallopeptidase [Senegalia massiliensis]